jgi:manganese/zinc/iron transport system permease protein
MGAEFVTLSLVPMLVAILAAVACALPGTFLILRGQAMVGDMMAHAALPGIVAAFLLTGGISGLAMAAGATVAALAAVGAVGAVRALTGVNPGAAMGMVFTTLFALGVLLLELSGAGGVHLDVDHALFGNLESLIWFDAAGWGSLADPAALATLPPELPRLALVTAGIALAMLGFWRVLVMASFDPLHARGVGVPVTLVNAGLMAAVAFAAVAAFTAVGSILTIAMLIVPAATARLLTVRLPRMVALSAALAAGAAGVGYVLAGYGPLWLGAEDSVSAAGMIACVAGAGLALAAVAGPHRRRA